MDNERAYYLSEMFHSIQGEGVWTGRLMCFVRLSGCNVGMYKRGNSFPAICTAGTGKEFICDTDFRKYFKLEAFHIVNACWEGVICLTGGEPLVQPVGDLVSCAHAQGIRVHLETSGTIPIPENVYFDWVTVSPKRGWLPEVIERANELKFLWHYSWGDKELEELKTIAQYGKNATIYVSPVNKYKKIDKESLDSTLKVLRRFPHWMLNVQLHKLLEVR